MASKPQFKKFTNSIFSQNIFHAVVEVPRWTNAKMEVHFYIFTFVIAYDFITVCMTCTFQQNVA